MNLSLKLMLKPIPCFIPGRPGASNAPPASQIMALDDFCGLQRLTCTSNQFNTITLSVAVSFSSDVRGLQVGGHRGSREQTSIAGFRGRARSRVIIIINIIRIKILMWPARSTAPGTSRGGKVGKVFPGPATFGGGPPSLKNTENGVPESRWLLSELKYA